MSKRCSIYIIIALTMILSLGAQVVLAADTDAAMADRARVCGVFSGTIDQVQASVHEGAIKADAATQLLSPLVAACEAQLPLAPFEDKLAEGLAKRVPPPLIIRALDRKLGDYRFALGLLGGPSEELNPELLIVIGEGLSKGVSRDVFEDYMSSYSKEPAGSLLSGAEMTSLLSQADFDYQLTRSMLDAGFESGEISPQWRYFIRIVLVARQRGISDVAIADAAKAVLADGGSLTDVSSRLGFTSRSLTGRNISN